MNLMRVSWVVPAILALTSVAQSNPYSLSLGELVRLNLSEQTIEIIGPVGAPGIIAIAHSSDGFLYSVDVDADMLIRIDPQTGAGVAVGPLGVDVDGGAQDLAEDNDGQLWFAWGPELYRIDRTTGTATWHCTGNGIEFYGLSFSDDGGLTTEYSGAPADPGCGLDYLQNAFSLALTTASDGDHYYLHPLPSSQPMFSVMRVDSATGDVERMALFVQVDLTGLAFSDQQPPSSPIPVLGLRGAFIFGSLMAFVGILVLARFRLLQ